GRVARKCRPAHPAGWRNVAHLAVLLDAAAERLAPEARLIVVEAARVQTQVAAERPHVAQQRAGNGLCRLVQHGEAPREERGIDEGRDPRERADPEALFGIEADEIE